MFSNRTLDEASRLEQLERDAAVQAIRARIPTGESARVCCNPQCGRRYPKPAARPYRAVGTASTARHAWTATHEVFE